MLTWSILIVLVVVVFLILLVPGNLAEQGTRQTLVGSIWQLTSYNYLVFDGVNGDHRSDTVAIAHPERYSLIFNADGTAVLTADCYRSIWSYTIGYGPNLPGVPPGNASSRFELQQDAEVLPGCEPARDVAVDVTGGYAADRFKIFLARTWGLEFRSGTLVLLRPLETDPFTGRYPDRRPLEQVFVAAPRQ